jgi:hypothetical protein
LLTELGKKTWPSLGVGYSPNAANKFTRGGFLECAEQASPLPSWPNQQRCPDRHAFKKTCPFAFEFTRHVQLKADNPIDR